MKNFALKQGQIYAIPILHYTMELAMHVKLLFDELQPDCVAVELPETFQNLALQAASRLPDISVLQADRNVYLCEPCDATFEGLRCAIENNKDAYCIDLDVENYPQGRDLLPDQYSIIHIGLKAYYETCLSAWDGTHRNALDKKREIYMARRLKELTFQYEKILFIGGFYHIASILELTEKNVFEKVCHIPRDSLSIATLTDASCREVMAEYGWLTCAYESWRASMQGASRISHSFSEKKDLLAECSVFPKNCENSGLDRQKILYNLYKASGERYCVNTGHAFPGYHLRNIMKFVRNYAWIQLRLMPELFEILCAAKGCVDHNYAYETWYLATHYPYRKNIDNLEELNLTVEEVWGHSKLIRFHLKHKQRKGLEFHLRKKDCVKASLYRPPSPFSICSFPPEDSVIEKFGSFLQKKGNSLHAEEGISTAPFVASLEDGIDAKETIRNIHSRKLYVKRQKRPPGTAGSVVVIFHEDMTLDMAINEKYPWKMTWHGENKQESDMAFYATSVAKNVVGPGISRCEYGGFMMSYPPRRLMDVWQDLDYRECISKAEVLLMAALDYSLKPLVIYVAERPPRSKIKNVASRLGKKIVFIPLKQLSPPKLNKIRVFHVLDGYDKREIAGDYIF